MRQRLPERTPTNRLSQVVTTVIFRAAQYRGDGTLLKGFRLHLTVVEQMWVTCSKEDITVQGRVHQLMVILLLGSPGAINTIDKFPFTSGFTTATDVGNLTGGRNKVAGQSSIPNGYGYNTGGGNVIDKFSFSSDGDATVAGNTLTTRSSVAGQSSATHGYTSGNYPLTTDIDKFPFSSDDDATDVGDLTLARGL